MAESRRLRTQADGPGNVTDDCGHCTLLPTVNGWVRAAQSGCPVHGDWVRTQAERATDGTTWRAANPSIGISVSDEAIDRILAENAHMFQPQDPDRDARRSQ